MPWARIRLLIVLAVTLVAGRSWAQLCAPAADPCVVAADVNVAGGTTIDLGTRALVIGASRTITAQGTGTGALTIKAGDITFLTGAKIVAPGVGGYGGTVTLQAQGGVIMQASSRIDTTAGGGGDITIIADHADLDGQIRAPATNRDDDGGYVTVWTTHAASIGGLGMELTAGDRFGSGGALDVIAGGDIEVTAPIVSKGGLEGGDLSFDGANIAIKAGGDLTAVATAPLGDGGSVSFRASGTVTIDAAVALRSAGSLLEGAGFAGDFDLFAAQAILHGPIDMSGPGPDGEGGFLDVTTDGDVTITSPILLSGAAEGGGGDMIVTAGGNATVSSSINLTGGYAGGAFEVTTLHRTDLTAGFAVDVSAIPGLAVLGLTGDVIVHACDATIAGKITSLGSGTQPSVRTSTGGALSVGATIKASGGTAFRYRSTVPTLLPGAVIVPAPTLVKDSTIPCCGDCTTSTTIVGETTTTSTTWTTSTSELPPTSTSTTILETTTSTSTVTTTSSSSSSSSTVASSTSSTTVTTIPSTCLDEPLEGYDALACVVSLLDEMVTSQSEIALGGRKSAKRLAGKVTKMQALIDKSRTSPKAAKLLVKAEKKVVSFQTQIAKLQAQAKIGEPLATDLLELSGEVTVRIDGVLTPLAN